MAKLHQAIRDLEVASARINSQWQDDKFREFQETFIEPLKPNLRGTVTAINDLADTLNKAERELGDF